MLSPLIFGDAVNLALLENVRDDLLHILEHYVFAVLLIYVGALNHMIFGNSVLDRCSCAGYICENAVHQKRLF